MKSSELRCAAVNVNIKSSTKGAVRAKVTNSN